MRKSLVLLALALVALGVRVAALVELRDNPFFDLPIVDSETYDRMAQAIAQGQDPYPGRPFFQPPLYPYFLGLLYRLVGRDLFAVRFLQLLLGTANVLLTYSLGLRLFGRRVALLAGLGLAFFGTAIFFDTELLAPVLLVFLNLLLMKSLVWFFESPAAGRAVVVGLCVGASAITMAVILPFALAVMIYAWRRRSRHDPRHTTRSLIYAAACYLLGLALLLAPVTWRNWKMSRSFIPISTNGGINLYIGAGEDFDKKVGIRPGYQWQALVEETQRAGIFTAQGQSRYFLGKAWTLVREHPIAYARSFLYKLYLFAHGEEQARNQGIYPFRHDSHVLALLLWKRGIAFPFGVLFPLAVLGAAVAIRRREAMAGLMTLFVLSHMLTIAFFFVCARYRMNVLPFLVLFAAYGVVFMVGSIRSRAWRPTLLGACSLVALLFLCNWKVGTMAEEFNGDAYAALGVRVMNEGRPAKALFQKALQLQPDLPEANGNLGYYLMQEGRFEEARACFGRILDQYPDDIGAHINLGNILAYQGQIEKAKEHYRKVLAVDPWNAMARRNLQLMESRNPSPP